MERTHPFKQNELMFLHLKLFWLPFLALCITRKHITELMSLFPLPLFVFSLVTPLFLLTTKYTIFSIMPFSCNFYYSSHVWASFVEREVVNITKKWSFESGCHSLFVEESFMEILASPPPSTNLVVIEVLSIIEVIKPTLTHSLLTS